MEKAFSTFSVLKEAHRLIKPMWKEMMRDYGSLVGLFLVVNALGDRNGFVTAVTSALLSYFLVVMTLAYAEKGSFKWNDFFIGFTFKKYALFFVTGFLVCLAFIGGAMLMFLPGILALVQLYFVKFIAVEEDMTPMAVLKKSAKLTKGNRLEIFEFFLVSLIINILGAACLVIGVFYTIPLTMTATLLVYRKLSGKSTNPDGEVVDAVVKEA